MRVPLLLLFTGCASAPLEAPTQVHTEDGHFALELEWDPEPLVGEQTIHLAVADADGDPLAGAVVDVDAWMPAHQHGIEPIPVEDVQDGHYLATWSWPMAGTWELTLTVDDGERLDVGEAQVDVR